MSPPHGMTGEQALATLLEGHARFRAGTPQPRGAVGGAAWRSLNEAQVPLAALVTCSDARISPDILFDQLPGALFEIRVAGPVASSGVIGSLDFAILELAVPLVLVMSHARCGAVQAAWSVARAEPLSPAPASGPAPASPLAGSAALAHLVSQIALAPEDLEPGVDPEDLGRSERENARAVSRALLLASAPLARATRAGELLLRCAHYDLAHGEVTLSSSP